MLLVGFLALDSAPAGIDAVWVMAAAAIGALGGMFGVNLQKTKLLESIKFETILLKICYTGFI